MITIGHRGCRGPQPENTLAAIRHALAAGATWIEVDVRLVDDQLFVIHDDTLERTTNGSGSVYAHSAAQLREIEAGSGEPIPLLDEVLALIDARAGLNIELKDVASAAAVLASTTEALQNQPAWAERLLLSSFEESIHEQLATGKPRGCRFGVLTTTVDGDLVARACALGAWSLNLAGDQLTPELIAQAHAAGLAVYVYTVNETQDVRRCRALGIDAIYTDYPARTIALLAADANASG